MGKTFHFRDTDTLIEDFELRLKRRRICNRRRESSKRIVLTHNPESDLAGRLLMSIGDGDLHSRIRGN